MNGETGSKRKAGSENDDDMEDGVFKKQPIPSKDGTRLFENKFMQLTEEEGMTSVEAKKELKRLRREKAKNAGFDGVGGRCTESKLKKIAQIKGVGDWKAWKVISLNYTYVGRRWTYRKQDGTVESCEERSISPYGMKEFQKKVLNTTVICNHENIPGEVRAMLKYTKECFQKDNIKFDVFDDGDLGYDMFYWVYCTRCIRNKLAGIIDGYKHVLTPDVTAEALMDHWDALDAMRRFNLMNLSDIVGCILPNRIDVKAGPNAKRFIMPGMSDEHAKTQHRWDQPCLSSMGRTNDLWMGEDSEKDLSKLL